MNIATTAKASFGGCIRGHRGEREDLGPHPAQAGTGAGAATLADGRDRALATTDQLGTDVAPPLFTCHAATYTWLLSHGDQVLQLVYDATGGKREDLGPHPAEAGTGASDATPQPTGRKGRTQDHIGLRAATSKCWLVKTLCAAAGACNCPMSTFSGSFDDLLGR